MKATYWVSTCLLVLFVCWSAYTYFFSKVAIEGVRDLGFPDFFRVQLGVLKFMAAVIILLPQIPIQAKEWAYAGVALFFLTAIVAHLAHKDSMAITVVLVLLLGVLVVSNVSLHKLDGA